jgi:hypothetical protein
MVLKGVSWLTVLQYPQLSKVVHFCCIPQHKSVRVAVKLSTSGLLVATNEKEYKSIKDWFYSEFKPRLPENNATLYDIPQSNRDFFTKLLIIFYLLQMKFHFVHFQLIHY